jgi:hypothetical protein
MLVQASDKLGAKVSISFLIWHHLFGICLPIEKEFTYIQSIWVSIGLRDEIVDNISKFVITIYSS